MAAVTPIRVAQGDGFFADEGAAALFFPPPPPVLVATLVTDPRGHVTLHRFDEGVELYRRGEALKVAFTP